MHIDPYQLYLLAVAVLATSTVLTIWTTRNTLVRITSVLLFFMVSALCFISIVLSFSHPKSTTLETIKADAAAVLSARMDEGVAIYVWLQIPGDDKPRYYSLPWDKKLAEQMQKAMEEQQKGDQMMLANPFEKSWDKQERKFYNLPQPKMPDKPQQQEAPVYKQQDL